MRIIVVLILAIALYFTLRDVILKQIYPQTYSEYVYQYAQDYQVDSLLVFAIIKAESNFKLDSSSKSGAIGLMQLVMNTAKEVAEDIEGMDTVTVEDLYNPQINIQLGTKYFSRLLKKYDGNIGLALAAYNAGMGNVDRWIAEGTVQADGSDIENIPYRETNNYVRKILNSYEIYQNLYRD